MVAPSAPSATPVLKTSPLPRVNAVHFELPVLTRIAKRSPATGLLVLPAI
jgi:hypothetical protein